MKYDLSQLGIDVLNPMQETMLEEMRRLKSAVLLSPTGSGKTLAYLLPLLEAMPEESEGCDVASPEVMVIVPSRELAIQTAEVAQKLARGARPYACYGGRPAMDEHRAMAGVRPRVMIGTPGRLLDHMGKGNFSLERISALVIDEFDKSLELGFQQQMQDIISLVPPATKRILLSATDCVEIPRFVGLDENRRSQRAERHLRLDFLSDAATDYSERINQYVVRSPQKDKLETLARILCSLGEASSIVFLNYREAVDRVFQYLQKEGFMVTSYHGAMEQKDRERSLFRFQSGCCNILLSTDLAARGLDIDGVENIIHYHLPQTPDAYIHRNGRTARWDRQGSSYVILGPEETTERFLEEGQTLTEVPVPDATVVPSARWETLYIGRGKKDKVNKVDIVGFLSKQAGLEREQIGIIKVFPSWSFVAIDRKYVKHVLQSVKGKKIKGQRTVVEVNLPRPKREGSR